MVTLAGIAAQRRYSRSSVRHIHGSADRESAANLLGEMVGSEEELDAYLNLLNIRVRNMVSSEAVWIRIQAVAEELMIRRSLSGSSVRKVASGAIQRYVTLQSSSKLSGTGVVVKFRSTGAASCVRLSAQAS